MLLFRWTNRWATKTPCQGTSYLHHVPRFSSSLSVSHPYQYEITNFTPPGHLFNPPSSPTSPEPLSTSPPVTYVSHASQLPALLETLKQASEIAVDLEHHSYRSFAGFVCLMQVSTRTQDWIIDCLDPGIRVDLECLNEVFTDPNIVKVPLSFV